MGSAQVPIQKMEMAARNVDSALVSDNNAPRLIELMNVSPQSGSTASGLTDHDYPVLTGLRLSASNLTQIKCISDVPLPPEFVDHLSHTQCQCMMGLFSEIGRAWLTVDTDIYMWTYEENTDLAYYDGINETILCVGLVKPKPGVFHSFVKHLLLLATSVDIVVLVVTFTEDGGENMDKIQLVPDPVFMIPTDGSVVSVITGTEDGRIFYGTKEGSLFEITYQAESGWFGKRYKKINLSTSALSFLVPSFLNAALSEEDSLIQISIDDSRHILYTLSEKGVIEVFDLGEAGNSFSKITKMSQNTLVNRAMNTVKTLDSQNFRPIVSISAIESYESCTLNLVAISQTGVRFYLSVVGLSNLQPNQRPYTLTLVHVRLPPGYSANITVRPRAVHVAHYRDRNLALISSVNEKDVLWCMSSDLFPFSQSLMEAYTAISLNRPAYAIAEVKFDSHFYYTPNQEVPPTVVRQHIEPPKKYVVLTSQGIQIFMKLRPVDILRQILKDSHGQDTEALKAFFMIQKEDQACATALILASLESEGNVEIADYATRAFFSFGGEPKLAPVTSGNIFSPSIFAPNVVSTPAPHHFQQPFSPLSQTMSLPPPHNTSLEAAGPFLFSSKHNGLYLYLGRILRFIWNRRCVDKVSVDGKVFVNQSTVSGEDCISILNNLTALHNFLIRNTQLSTMNSTTLNSSANMTRTNHTIQDAQSQERQSLDAFKVFVCHCCQIIGLWRILCEHQFHSLIGSMPENHQQVLQNTTFKDLFLYRQDICFLLISTLINSYLGDNASVDSISNKLREVCPHLYKTEDAAFSKAYEILKSVRSIQNKDEQEEMLSSAMQLCISIAPNLNLNEICKEFVSLKAYKAVVKLCAYYGMKIDPDQIAESFYNADDNLADQEGFGYFQRRMEIYKQILNMLDHIYNEQIQNPQPPPSTEITEGSCTGNESILLNGTIPLKMGSVMQQVIADILDNPDEIMHIALYEWMVSKNMASDLIKINNPSLETYLKKTSVLSADNVPIMDLLWKYYESNGNHAAAAKILNNLASRPGVAISLKERLAYLARAIMCMRNDKVGYAPYLGVFLRDLEDRMEVAKVQEQILDTILNKQDQIPNAPEIITELNSELYEISRLYENFAEPFDLLECQLAIIDCAGYTDNVLIESIWHQILTEEIRKSNFSGNDRMAQILVKVKNLSRLYAQSMHCFPLNYIVYELEVINAKLKGDKHMVPTTLFSMNIPFEKLITVYNNLITISGNDHFWHAEENESHLCEATAALIDCFINEHDKYSSLEKRKITSLCQDTLASLFSNLYSKPNMEHLVNQLRSIQARLSRM